MNDLFVALGIEAWKGAVAALVMPPVPFLVLVLLGARLMFHRRLLAWLLVLLGVAGIWLSACWGTGTLLQRWLLDLPRALSPSEIAELRRAPKTAIVVLGGGRKLLAPEYGTSDLSHFSMERLRYGLWLGRETGLPVAFSGGVGHGSQPGPSEAEIAARIAEREFGRTLKWTEGRSRDTNENALRTVDLLHPQGIERIVLVTHDYHMRRAMAAFQRASERAGKPVQLVAAPMGIGPGGLVGFVNWVPSTEGFLDVRLALHEWLGRLAGA